MKAFMIVRDRLSYAQHCLTALRAAGLDVVLVDHGSTFPPMVDWLASLETYADEVDQNAVPWTFWGENRHPRDLWRPGGPIAQLVSADERFIVTDCDVVPSEACPTDWVWRLGALLDQQPVAKKAGLGLRTDDLPDHFERAAMVRVWERLFQHRDDGGHLHAVVGLGAAVWADIDTTLAMYRRYEPFALWPALRMRAPYVAWHLQWYEDTANPTVEQMYYREHAAYGHWRAPEGYSDTHNLGGST